MLAHSQDASESGDNPTLREKDYEISFKKISSIEAG